MMGRSFGLVVAFAHLRLFLLPRSAMTLIQIEDLVTAPVMCGVAGSIDRSLPSTRVLTDDLAGSQLQMVCSSAD
jgi:hypothetical protein